MLDQARKKDVPEKLHFICGSAEHIPAQSMSTDLVFMSNVFHHLEDPEKAAHECFRILHEGGHLCLKNTTIDPFRTFAYVEFFPGVYDVFKDELPTKERVIETFKSVGFEAVADKTTDQETRVLWREYVDAISSRSDSGLARITDEEFEKGLKRVRAIPDKGQSIKQDPYNFFIFRKPGSK